MTPELITSRRNPLVKRLRSLHQAKGREQEQRLLLEGTNLLVEALRAHFPLETVCYTSAWTARQPELSQQLQRQFEAQSLRLVEVSEEVLGAIATTQAPDGIVAVAPRQTCHQPQFPCSLAVAVETLQDPGNLGTIIRTAAATDVAGLWLSQDSVAFDHPKVLRASAGQWFQLPLAVSTDLTQTLRQAKATGMQVVATLPTAEKAHWDLDWTQPSLIVLGNEGAGLSDAVAALADTQVQIPLWRGVESLNVAISLAVLLYEAQRQRRPEANRPY